MTPTVDKPQSVTLSVIARQLKLSPSTVSFVLSGNARRYRIGEKTVDRVLKAAREAGYVANAAARDLRRNRTGILGVILGDISHDRAYFLMKGLLPVAENKGFTAFISTSLWDLPRHQRELTAFAERRAEGILCEPFPGAEANYRQLIRAGIPIVFVGDRLASMPEASSVAWDMGAAAQVAMNHLIDTGRKRIGFVGHDWPTQMRKATVRAYRRSLREAGLKYNPAWDGSISYPQTVERFVDAVLKKRGKQPDAFFVTNDAIAIHLLTCLEERGRRVPEDIAVIGLGDYPLSSVYGGRYGAGLSTVRQPLEEIGKQTAELMLEIIARPKGKAIQRTVSSVELIVRRTTVQESRRATAPRSK